MRVDVIIPFYNEISFIKKAIDSILNQEAYQKNLYLKIFVINDGPYSENKIREIIGEYAFTPVDLFIIRNKNPNGPGGARNTGLDASDSDYVAFLDSDDIWEKNKLKTQLSFMEENNLTFSSTSYAFIGSERVNIRPPKRINSPHDVFTNLGIGTSTVIIDRDLIGNLRFKDLKFSQDIDFWYRLAHDKKFKYLPLNKTLTKYYLGGRTKNKIQQLLYFTKMLNSNNLNIFFKIYVLLLYSLRGLVNHLLRK